MNAEMIRKALKSVELCAKEVDENNTACKECPYYKPDDRTYKCIDNRYKDLAEVLEWSLNAYETVYKFLYPGK